MKKEVVYYIDIFIECQKVKDEHIHPNGMIQPFPFPQWKLEVLTVDFITKLPRTMKQCDSIMVVDK